MMRTHADRGAAGSAEASGQTPQGCDHPECPRAGLYPAPKARDRLRDYHWFCLEHVRAYNSAWNYCVGYTEAEIEAEIRSATCWDRPTWRLGHWQGQRAEAEMTERSGAFRAASGKKKSDKRSRQRTSASNPSDGTAGALSVLGLDSAATPAEIKARYKHLVKRYHPDANGGDKQAEERLKTINQAYTTLRVSAPV